MTAYQRPDVYAEEVEQLEGPVQPAATGFGAMEAVTQKGPIGTVIRSRTFPAWQKVYGGREEVARGDGAYEAKAFFDEGGVELITNRVCHFSDIEDKTSYTGGVANNIAETDGVGPSAASKVGAIGTYLLVAGGNFDLDVNNIGPATVTFDASPGSVIDSTGYPVADQNGLTLILAFDGGANQTVTFAGATTTLAQIVSQINAQIYGGKAEDNGGQLEITSDKEGTGSSVSIVGGTHGLTFGVPTAGAGDVVDIRAVTAAEVEAIIENDTTAEVTVNPNGSITITSPTTGATSELDFQAGSPDILAALGLSVEVINGTDAGATYNTLKFEAGYQGYPSPGVNGNTLKRKIAQNPLHSSQGAGADLATSALAGDMTLEVTSIANINEKSVIKIWDGTNTEYHEVEQVRSEVVGSTVSFFIDLVGAGLVNPFAAASAQIQTMEFDVEIYENTALRETWQGMSMLDTADNYVETVMNDESTGSQYVMVTDLDASPPGLGADTPATDTDPVVLSGGTDETLGLTDADYVGSELGGTGFYAFDQMREFTPMCTPNRNTAAVVHGASVYCERRMYMEYIAFVDVGATKAQAVAYRNNTLGLSSKYVSLYAGGMKIFDPIGSGSAPRRLISGVGGLMGLRARVDGLPDPNGGPWQTPAGEGDYGKLRSALDVSTIYNDTEAGEMNVAGINVIRKFGRTSPVLVWGGRTLYSHPNKKWLYINVMRMFQYVEKSLVDSTRWAVFRNNDFRLWGSIKDRGDTWLESLMARRAFPTMDKNLAYFILCGFDDGTMDQSNVDNGECIIEVGLAPNKPAEFIIFRFSQYESGYTLTEL